MIEEPTQWLIPELLPVGAGGIIHGARGTYKSFYALRLAWDLATGQAVLGRWSAVPPVPVLLFQGEGAVADWQARIKHIRAYYEPVIYDPDFFAFHSLRFKADSVNGKREVNRIIADVRPKLVIFDPLVRFFTGSDRDQPAVHSWIDLWNEWRSAYQTAVLVMHHDRQARSFMYQGKFLTENRGMDEARGLSDLPDWADFMARTTKVRGLGHFQVEKVRDREAPDHAYKYRWEDGLMVAADAESAVTTQLIDLVTHSKAGVGRGALVSRVADETNMSARQVRRHLDTLVETNYLAIEESPKNRNRVLITIPTVEN